MYLKLLAEGTVVDLRSRLITGRMIESREASGAIGTAIIMGGQAVGVPINAGWQLSPRTKDRGPRRPLILSPMKWKLDQQCNLFSLLIKLEPSQ